MARCISILFSGNSNIFGFLKYGMGCGLIDIFKCSPSDTNSKYIWVCGSNFKLEQRIRGQTDR